MALSSGLTVSSGGSENVLYGIELFIEGFQVLGLLRMYPGIGFEVCTTVQIYYIVPASFNRRP